MNENRQLYNLSIVEDHANRLESLLVSFRIGFNDWDKTRVFETESGRLIVYTIFCKESTINSIVTCLERD